ncbi:hypothetical protein QTQ03_24425 [Micromonospora sp. WMMA1363]|uniref:hypothetical protein n=1 Tax=Micromonospora sp. WMMA1363 TaxID=3053985 RepID=UPI00259CFC9B|nr:hypothetical protein [Micromonospora sp. WMMA1363]MDM4722584.1 hypothetical protein [Micromonospora sp. WMMA1363]
MSSPAEPASTDPTPASQLTRPLREPAAFVLLGANAVLVFVGLIRLLTPTGYGTFTSRAGSGFSAFVGVEAVALPLLAVLLATHLRPVVPRAKLVVQVAAGEYAASAVLGGLTFLIWSLGRLAGGEVVDAFLGTLTRLAWLAVLGIAGYAVYRIWRTLYHVPKPKPQPGLYGTPQPGWPSQPGQPAGQTGFGQSDGWAGPTRYAAPHDGSPAAPFPGAPHSAPPANPAPPAAATPRSVPAAGPTAPPFGQPPSADPTQAVPRQPAETQAVPRQPAETQAVPRQPAETQVLPGDDDPQRTQRINPSDG